jgi:hypothetical protein
MTTSHVDEGGRNVRDGQRESNDVLDRAVAGESVRTLQNLGQDDPNAATNPRFRTTYEH